jgi:hypothetical protein
MMAVHDLSNEALTSCDLLTARLHALSLHAIGTCTAPRTSCRDVHSAS